MKARYGNVIYIKSDSKEKLLKIYTYFVCCDWEDGIAKNLPFADEMVEEYKGVEKLLNKSRPVYITNLFTDRGRLYTGSYFVDPQTGETTPIPEEDRAVKERYRIR